MQPTWMLVWLHVLCWCLLVSPQCHLAFEARGRPRGQSCLRNDMAFGVNIINSSRLYAHHRIFCQVSAHVGQRQ